MSVEQFIPVGRKQKARTVQWKSALLPQKLVCRNLCDAMPLPWRAGEKKSQKSLLPDWGGFLSFFSCVCVCVCNDSFSRSPLSWWRAALPHMAHQRGWGSRVPSAGRGNGLWGGYLTAVANYVSICRKDRLLSKAPSQNTKSSCHKLQRGNPT